MLLLNNSPLLLSNKETMKQKIKDGDKFELYGIKVIARSSCPKDTVYLVNDKLFSGGHSNGKSNYWDILKKSVKIKLSNKEIGGKEK